MPVEEVRSLIRVAVPPEHEVHPGALKHGQHPLPHLEHRGLVFFAVRVVPERVGRVVEEGNEPALLGRLQVLCQPGQHGAVDRAIRAAGVETDEVDVGVVKAVVGLGARCDAARLALSGQQEDVEEGAGLGLLVDAESVVVSNRRPDGRGAQDGRVHIEQLELMFTVRPEQVGVIAQGEPDISRSGLSILEVRVAHSPGVVVACARVANHPDPHGFVAARWRRCGQVVGWVVAGKDLDARSHAVEVSSARGEPREHDLVLGGQGRVCERLGELARR